MKLESYLTRIKYITDELGVGTYAFRGQGNAHWPLHSAATRRLRRNRGEGVQNSPEFTNLYLDYHKTTLIAPARTQGFGFEAGREISDLQLLAKLQHLGAATGLLDFSWSPLVGLWFACGNAAEDGKLYIINTNDPIQMAMIPNDEARQEITTLFLPDGEFPDIAYWEPMASGDAMARILRQRSVFVIGRPKIPEDSNILGEVVVARDDKEELMRELALLDISLRSLFLDAHGFSATNRVSDAVLLSQDDYLIAGNWYYQRGEHQYAIEAFNRFIQLNPDTYRVYLLRANAHAELRNHVEAVADYDKVVSTMIRLPQGTTPGHMVYFNRANSKAELGLYKEAVQDYLLAIELAPDPTPYYFNLANTYADMFLFEEAISAYENAEFGDWRTIFNKGNALMCTGRFGEAYECYNLCAIQAPAHETVTQNMWTSSRLLGLLAGRKFTRHLDTSRNYIGLCVSPTDFTPELQGYTYVVAGRVGNRGNDGYSHRGGQGFTGKGPIMIGISKGDSEHD